jgi:hypothetical protein
MRLTPAILVLAGICAGLARVCAGLETDQFTPPPRPLADLGPDFQVEVKRALQEACDRVNEKYEEHLLKAAKAPFKFIRNIEDASVRERLTESCIARAVFQATVRGGYSQCQMEFWARYGEFAQQPARFDPPLRKTVYDTLTRPITIFYISPTVNFWGLYFGTDKLGHFFEQGYEYYEVYQHERSRGLDDAEAIGKAVKLGVAQEKGIYGLMIDGCYSNADLAANYAGVKFYINLTRPLTIDGIEYPPILILENNRWRLNPAAGDDFVRPFFTEHFNEAFNPCRYNWPFRNGVRENVKRVRSRWMEFYHSTPQIEQQRLERITRWHGDDYGHCGFDNLVTLVNTN